MVKSIMLEPGSRLTLDTDRYLDAALMYNVYMGWRLPFTPRYVGLGINASICVYNSSQLLYRACLRNQIRLPQKSIYDKKHGTLGL